MDVYGLVGKPISHSFSSKIYNFLFDEFNIDAVYRNFECEERDILPLINSGVKGLNFTAPYKNLIYDLMKINLFSKEFINTVVAHTHVVNILKIINNELYLNNSDIYAIIECIDKITEKIDLKTILILGNGDTCKSIYFALFYYFNCTIYNSNRSNKAFEKCVMIDWNDREDCAKKVDLIINATSVKDELIINPFGAAVFDINYNPETTLIKLARENGNIISRGEDMLINQAISNFNIWCNISLSDNDVMALYDLLSLEKNP